MSLVICDTNIFISLFKEYQETIADLKTIGDANVLITSISVMELYRGMENKKELKAIKNVFSLEVTKSLSLISI